MNVIEQNTLKLRKFLLAFSLVLGFSNLNAQQIFCGSITVSLDPATCTATISPGDLVENPGDFLGFPAGFVVDLFYDEDMTLPVPTSPVLTAADIGLSIIAQVTNVGGDGNSCWTTIGPVSDYSIPALVCGGPFNVLCTDDLTPTTTPGPGTPLGFPVPGGVTVVDNLDGTYTLQNFDACGDAILVYDDASVDGACPAGPIETITRTWIATDGSGNTSTCTETIIVDRITNPALVIFPLQFIMECDGTTPNTNPSNTGYPQVNGEDITGVLNYCELQSAYTDVELDGCGGSVIVNRTWTVYNCMGMVLAGPLDQQIKILDTTGPSVTCPDDITIGTEQLTCTGTTTLPATTISDLCSGYTSVTTADHGTISGNVISDLPLGTTIVTVTATDDCGNTSSCTYEIEVEDDTPPITICETTHTVALTNAEPTYVPAIIFDDDSQDACGGIVSYEVRRLEGTQCSAIDATDWGNNVPFYCCDIGEIIEIELRVMDAAGNFNSCTVDVEVEDNIIPQFTFCPGDVDLQCGDDKDDLTLTGEALVTDNCENVTPTYEDEGTLTCGTGEITRTWSVTDNGGNTVTCVQQIFYVDPSPFYISDTGCDDADPADGVIWPCVVTGISGCDSPTSGAPSPTELGSAPIILNNACAGNNIVVTYKDEDPIDFPGVCVKYHRVWKVYNCCASPHILVGQYTQLIEIESSAPPTVICGDIQPVDDGEISIVTLIASDDCTTLDNLIITYEVDLFSGGTNPDMTGIGTDASGVYPVGTHIVTFDVEDDCGSVSSCSSTVIVNPPTPPSVTVSGGIENEEGDLVEHVMVEVSGDMNEEEETTEAGAFSFDLPTASNYAITPGRFDNPLNGVSTFDLVKISQHILESELLASPYKMIAADVNRSGSITTVDLVELRKLILFIETEFANNTSWRFVDADFVFPNALNPFQTSFPEVYTINDLEDNMLANFVGVKVGDVNCSAAANDFAGSSDDRNVGSDLIFYVDDQSLTAGETYTIDFNIDDISNLQGYQFTLAFDQGALYFENLSPGMLQGITENNFGLSLLDKGVITTSWNTAGMLNTQKGTSFSITFTAMIDTKLSEVININSRYTKAQAYINNESADVSLAFESENGIALDHFQLFQNRPNPFKGETVISFNLPEDNAGTLTIYDLSGRVIKVVQENFSEGYNEVGISSTDMAGHGVFYYQLEVANYNATRRMVLLK